MADGGMSTAITEVLRVVHPELHAAIERTWLRMRAEVSEEWLNGYKVALPAKGIEVDITPEQWDEWRAKLSAGLSELSIVDATNAARWAIEEWKRLDAEAIPHRYGSV